MQVSSRGAIVAQRPSTDSAEPFPQGEDEQGEKPSNYVSFFLGSLASVECRQRPGVAAIMGITVRTTTMTMAITIAIPRPSPTVR